MKVLEVGSFAIGDIHIPPRLRDVDQNWVAIIAETMKAKGQLQGITVRLVDGVLTLVAGAHRIAAKKLNGETDIHGMLVEVDDEDEASELEAIENVARRELTALDKAIHLGVLRDLHQKRNPTARRNGDRKKQAQEAADKGQVQVLYFAQSVADTVKLSRASIYNYLGIFDRLEPKVREQLKGTPLADNMAELRALAAEEPKEQADILSLVMGPEPKATSINQAVSIHFNDVDTSTPDERDFARFVKLWSRASKKLRKNITSHIAKEQ